MAESDSQAMADQLCGGIVKCRQKVRMKGVEECDEVYVVAGHKARPAAVRW